MFRDLSATEPTMGRVVIKIPLVTWRDGWPRFWPSAAQRQLGYRGENLRHPDGRWFSLDEAIAWSQARQADIAERRAAAADAASAEGRKGASPSRPLARPRGGPASGSERYGPRAQITISQLVELWRSQPRFQGREVVEGRRRRAALAANTVRFYRTCAAALERHRDGRVWHEAAGALTVRALDLILERIEVEHGLAMTRGVRAMLSAAFAFGLRKGLVVSNPASGVRLPVPAARIRAGEPEEIAAFVEAADRLGRPDIGDAIMLGVWTGQRQGDRLALSGGQIVDDAFLFRQAKKHGQPILVPVSPQLAARLEAARARRRDWRVNYPHVVLDEPNRRPFAADWYRKVFAVIRHVAATGEDPRTKDSAAVLRGVDLAAALGRKGASPSRPLARPAGGAGGKAAGTPREAEQSGGEPSTDGRPSSAAPSGGQRAEASGTAARTKFIPVATLADLRDQDLRDTAVTWLARAECDVFQIASITGHELASIQTILKHYLGLHPSLGRSAIGKLVAWMEAQA